MRASLFLFSALSLSLAAAPAALASTVTYANITSGNATSASGNIGAVNFTYTGANSGVATASSPGINFFQPNSSFTSATITNAPTNGEAISISDSGTLHTFTFSAPVTNIIFDIASLGNSTTSTSYVFNLPFTVVACGPDFYSGGGCFSSGGVGSSGSILTGSEASGAIEFLTPGITSLSFTTVNGENFQAIDIGLVNPSVSATPEPSGLVLLGTGLLGVAGMARRRFAR